MVKSSKSTAVTVAVSNAGMIAKRFQAVEAEASRIHAEQSGATLVRALVNGSGLHAVLSDGKTTIEVCWFAAARSRCQSRSLASPNDLLQRRSKGGRRGRPKGQREKDRGPCGI
jgi:hypothetical protein